MIDEIILLAETGSDLTPALAEEYGVYLVPMHVSLGDKTLDDGSFPPEEVCQYYENTGKVPQTSASSPNDFIKAFTELEEKYPGKKILHLAYSAITTCSFQNALLAAEERTNVTSVDTKHVSVGQAVTVMETAKYLKANPDCSIEQAAKAAKEIAGRVQMCFIPDNLDYLRAGGRVSNAAALVGNLLSLHPCIEILDGQLIAKKKYRGRTDRIIPKVIQDFTSKHNLDPEHLYFIQSPRLDRAYHAIAEQTAAELGYHSVSWMNTGCVITSHSGPGAFGIVGLVRK